MTKTIMPYEVRNLHLVGRDYTSKPDHNSKFALSDCPLCDGSYADFVNENGAVCQFNLENARVDIHLENEGRRSSIEFVLSDGEVYVLKFNHPNVTFAEPRKKNGFYNKALFAFVNEIQIPEELPAMAQLQEEFSDEEALRQGAFELLQHAAKMMDVSLQELLCRLNGEQIASLPLGSRHDLDDQQSILEWAGKSNMTEAEHLRMLNDYRAEVSDPAYMKALKFRLAHRFFVKTE